MRYKTVVWNIMQLMFKNFNDHQLHYVISFDAHIDEECLKKAVDISENAFPIIGCRFVERSAFASPYWEKCNFTSSDIVEIVETSDAAGFREYMYMLSTIYSSLKNNTNYVCRYNMGSRSTKQIYKKFSFCNKMKILKSSSEVSKYNTGGIF